MIVCLQKITGLEKRTNFPLSRDTVIPAPIAASEKMIRQKTSGTVEQNNSRSAVTQSSNTIYVPDGYAKIQWAVDNASAGDAIIVHDGKYTEDVDVNVNNLTIRAQNGSTSTIVPAAKSSDYVIACNNIDYSLVWSGLHFVDINSVFICDADRDGRGDIVAGSTDDFSNKVHVFENIGDNAYAEVWNSSISGRLSVLVLGDTDKDGLKEIIIGNGMNSSW
ncbi:MAG: VCBS repeat-containing protein [Halobacteriota archaeon]